MQIYQVVLFIFVNSMDAEEANKNSTEETNDVSDELYQRFVFTADKGQEPFRIDKFLTNRIEGATRNALQQQIRYYGCGFEPEHPGKSE